MSLMKLLAHFIVKFEDVTMTSRDEGSLGHILLAE